MIRPEHEFGEELEMILHRLRVRRIEIGIGKLHVPETAVSQHHPERGVAGNPEVKLLFEKGQRLEQTVIQGIRIRGRQKKVSARLQAAVGGVKVFEGTRQVLDRSAQDHQVEEVLLAEDILVERDANAPRLLLWEFGDLHPPRVRHLPADGFQELARRAADVEPAALEEVLCVEASLENALFPSKHLETYGVVA